MATRGSYLLIESGDWRKTLRPDIPSPARIYDYLLGGKDHYPADREAGEAMVVILPNVRTDVQWNRAFLRRVVRYLVSEAGIRQFIDIGTGLPTVGNVHQVALHANPEARVVYVDNDPVVLAHARDMLNGIANTTIIEHDLRAPAEILADPGLRDLIDFDEPVAIMLLSILHFIADEDDPAGIIARLLEPFPPGSHIAISHGSPDGAPAANEVVRVFDEATAQGHVRTGAQVMELISGLDLVEPGMVWPADWRPEPGTEVSAEPRKSVYLAVVARKP
jgi:hypothetical protein